MIYFGYIKGGIIIEKKDLRQQQIQKLNQNKDQTQLETEILLQKLIESSEWQNATSIATTISGPFEVPTTPVIEAALAAGKKVYVPKTMPHRQMAFLPFVSYDKLVKSSFGLLEPEYDETLVNQSPDLIIVPGLAFAIDSHYRVGFGGGYYDRFLAKYTGQSIALVPSAMAFATADWKIGEYDIKIDKLIRA
ncbi:MULTISPECIES: 5-formyltetrahydrofolate cyclo-ligase [unclassified Companilactobacillus]|uniref:5-formyltetrahydrofolate cyclo-ligase n=1 Tax=unclassified Companilactobacillus TaxID=2767904 RepID=UPI002FF02A3B